MKLKCAVLDDYQNVANTFGDWDRVSAQIETTYFHDHFTDEEQLRQKLLNFNILVVMRERTPLRESLIKSLPNLKLIVTSGTRNSSIDLKAARNQGIVVCGTASGSEPPAELTWALILGLARNLVSENQAFTETKQWQSTVGTDLFGKTLGLLGLGKIGTKVANIGKAFGMNVIAWSPNLTLEKTNPLGVALAPSKEFLLQQSDFISIHLVLGDRSRLLIGKRELELMKRTSFLINTSRSGIVDTEALIEALRTERIAGAGIDVFDREPLPSDHPLRKTPRLLATPHLGYVSQSNYRKYFSEAIEDIEAFLTGKPIRILD